MNKKTQVAILMATLSMQVGAMEQIHPVTVRFNGFSNSENPFFGFKEAKPHLQNECRIADIYLKKNIPPKSVAYLVIPARTSSGHKVTLSSKFGAGWNNDNIKVHLILSKIRTSKKQKFHKKSQKRCCEYVGIIGDKSGLFKDSTSLVSVDMRGVDRKNARWLKGGKKQNSRKNYMTSMFEGCTALTSVKWGKLNTRNVTRMDYMFKDCKNLERLNLSHLNTSKVATMKGMFANCYKLEDLNMRLCNTSKVQNMEGMFLNCKALPSVNLTNFDIELVQNMKQMFDGCENMTSIEFPVSDAQNLATMQSMFENCTNLLDLDLSKVRIPNTVIMTDFITGCKNLDTISFHPEVPSEKVENAMKNCTNCPDLTSGETFHNG